MRRRAARRSAALPARPRLSSGGDPARLRRARDGPASRGRGRRPRRPAPASPGPGRPRRRGRPVARRVAARRSSIGALLRRLASTGRRVLVGRRSRARLVRPSRRRSQRHRRHRRRPPTGLAGRRRVGRPARPGVRRLAPRPLLERRADGERAREAVRLLVRQRARSRFGLGVAAMAVVRSVGPLVPLVLEGDERAGRRTVRAGQPSLGHRGDDTRRATPSPDRTRHPAARLTCPTGARTLRGNPRDAYGGWPQSPVRRSPMSRLTGWLAPTTTARAHCDLPCGVYDPEQARIEAESCHKINEKYAANEDADLPDARRRDQGRARRARQAPPRRPVARLLQARAPREGPEPARAVLERDQAGLEGQGLHRRRRLEEAARHDRRDRRRLEGDRRRREDARRGTTRLTARSSCASRGPADRRGLVVPSRCGRRLRGPWRLAIAQASMEPTIRAGDWLLVDPTTDRWPRRGTIVAFHEPDGGALSVKRVAAGARAIASRSRTATSNSPTTRRGSSPTPTPTTRRRGRSSAPPIDSRPLRAGAGRAPRRAGLVPLRPAGAGSGVPGDLRRGGRSRTGVP